jgi:GNAT superfamily N-acetyltransferase
VSAPEIREATEADFPRLRRLYIELHDYSALQVPSRLRIEDDYDEQKQITYLRELIAGESSTCVVALEGGEPLGLAEVRVKEPEQEEGVIPVRRAYLQSLVVTERARGTGVGSALLRAAEEWAMARGAEEMELDHWVFPGDPGAFYDNAGYRLISAMRVKPLSPDG